MDTNQKNVVIRSKSSQVRALRRNRISLLEDLDIQNSLLLDVLIAKEIVGRTLKEKIDGETVSAERARLLLDHLETIKPEKFNEFLQALKTTNHEHLADALIKFLETNSSEDDCETNAPEEASQVPHDGCFRCVQTLTVQHVQNMHVHPHGAVSVMSGSSDQQTLASECPHCGQATSDRGPLLRAASCPGIHPDNITASKEAQTVTPSTKSHAQGILRHAEEIAVCVTHYADTPACALTAGNHTVQISAKSKDEIYAWMRSLENRTIKFIEKAVGRDSGMERISAELQERDSGRFSGVQDTDETLDLSKNLKI